MIFIRAFEGVAPRLVRPDAAIEKRHVSRVARVLRRTTVGLTAVKAVLDFRVERPDGVHKRERGRRQALQGNLADDAMAFVASGKRGCRIGCQEHPTEAQAGGSTRHGQTSRETDKPHWLTR